MFACRGHVYASIPIEYIPRVRRARDGIDILCSRARAASRGLNREGKKREKKTDAAATGPGEAGRGGVGRKKKKKNTEPE